MICIINPMSYISLGMEESLFLDQDVVLICDEAKRKTYPESMKNHERIIYIKEFNDQFVIEGCKQALKQFDIDVFMSNDEEYLVLTGMINQELFADSNELAHALLFTDKYLMRTKLRGIVNQPNFYRIENTDMVKKVYTNHPVNYILKPRASSGSRGVYVIKSEADIDQLPYTISHYIMEEWVDYDTMYTCDGFFNEKGEVVECYIHEYGTKLVSQETKLDHADTRTARAYQDNLELIKQLKGTCVKAIKALAQSRVVMPMHMELFYNKTTGAIHFCEVGSRFGGARIPSLIDNAYGGNVKDRYWHMVFNQTILPENRMPTQIAGSIFIYKNIGIVKQVPTPEEVDWANSIQFYVIPGDETSTYHSVTDAAAFSLFNAIDEKDYMHKLELYISLSRKLYE